VLPVFGVFDNTGAPRNSSAMPPKADPYATPLHRRIDIFLWIFTALTAAIVFFVAAHG
jgi:hypothetical protein